MVGAGGREHALAWKLSQEAEVVVCPGNPGIAEDCETIAVTAKDHEGLVSICQSRKIDLVVVGPEDPLIDGLGDALRSAGIAVYGPNRDGAQLEGSKAFSKSVMQDAGVPTAAFESFTDPTQAIDYARRRFDEGRSVVVKASGNALGKGVFVSPTFEEAREAIERMMVAREFGTAGDTVVVEDRLIGPEFSLLTMVGDQNYVSLPVAQDHKRAYDGNLGPNTGGMGAFSPVPWITSELIEDVERRIVEPTLRALKSRGIPYRGTLFSGIMMDAGTPYCLEFNVRMGDPETQAVLLRVDGGYAEALYQAATGARIEPPTILSNAAVTVVVAAQDYPKSGSKGSPIRLGPLPSGAKLFHAGTALIDGRLVTSGGRVVAASASAETLGEARRLAYEASNSVEFEGARIRSDIAQL